MDVAITKLNYLQVAKKLDVMYHYEPKIEILPRTPDPIYVPPEAEEEFVAWKFPISLMAKWRPVNAQLVVDCFNQDFDKNKI